MLFGTIHAVHADVSPVERTRMREKIARDVERFLSDDRNQIEYLDGPQERPDYARPVYIHNEGNA